jgi:hypothetical protein
VLDAVGAVADGADEVLEQVFQCTIATTSPLALVTRARWLLLRRIRDSASGRGRVSRTRGSGRTAEGSTTASGSSISVLAE